MIRGDVLPIPYPDELLYSVIARYHLRTNNESPKWTFREIYGTENVIPTIDLPSHLEALARRSELQGMSADDWIDRHTFFPYYAPFLPKERANRLRTLMKSSDGSGIHALVGITASTIDRTNRLRFCPSCYEQDIQRYGEPYWHRIHQLPGVYLCHVHQRVLHEITAPLSDRHGLTVLPISRHMFRSAPIIESLPDKLIDRLLGIADDIQMLVQLDEPPALYDSRGKILPRLAEQGYVTAGEHIRQQKLEEQIVRFYSPELLELLESNLTDRDYSWLALSTRKVRWAIHPLRQLLLIRYLYGSFGDFLNCSKDYDGPFGIGPWPCLNKAAEHYEELVLTQCNITRCSDTGRPVGTFMCSCGFSYSRRGPDQLEKDKFHRGRIKSFGPVWVGKFEQCIQEGLSYRAVAKILGVDTNTVIKYAHTDIVETVKQPHERRSQKARRNLSSPVSRNAPKIRVDWEKRDLELSWEVESACKSILSDLNSKPIRISISLIGKRIGKLSWLEKHGDKLPVTMRTMSTYLESVTQFQKRRVRWAAEQLSGEWPLKRWKIEKLAGLRPDYSQEVSDEIDHCIGQSRYMYTVISSEGTSSWLH
ncbi:TnsD family Tn7-like transposition protein [Brevibacillus centrosporus]|uniref:TnsD family Tn7-like transposition protein n=1 Tax=Brevibacillus centrosporus TaxID=54910 RepID=UPI002E21E346|nr:TnsD family Tn7-like transposition protein [Brevibacillus centrosporus]